MCAVLTPSTRTSWVLPMRAALTLAASSLNTPMHSSSLCCFTSAGTSSCSRWEAWVFWGRQPRGQLQKKIQTRSLKEGFNSIILFCGVTYTVLQTHKSSPFAYCRQTGIPHCSPHLWSETESAGGRLPFLHRSLRWSHCWDSPLTHRHVINVKHRPHKTKMIIPKQTPFRLYYQLAYYTQ